jgi:hypothetical protein
MSSFSFTGKLPDNWEGNIYGSLSQAAGWKSVQVNDERPDGTFHATIQRVHSVDFANIRRAIEELGIQILGGQS